MCFALENIGNPSLFVFYHKLLLQTLDSKTQGLLTKPQIL